MNTSQGSKWDFNFGGQLTTNSKNLIAKVTKIGKNKYSFNDLIRVFKLNVVFCRPVLILKVQYFPLSGGKLSRISGRHLNYVGCHAGHQIKILVAKNKNLVAQATILVDKIEPCVTLKLCRKWH